VFENAPVTLLVMIVIGAAASYMWRALGVVLSGRFDPDGPAIRWVGCVAYGILAALIARMVLLPVGSLAGTPTVMRLVCVALALAAFYLFRRNLLLGVVAGGGSLTVLSFFY
jgi:branched-subunit amino acid transport protein